MSEYLQRKTIFQHLEILSGNITRKIDICLDLSYYKKNLLCAVKPLTFHINKQGKLPYVKINTYGDLKNLG